MNRGMVLVALLVVSALVLSASAGPASPAAGPPPAASTPKTPAAAAATGDLPGAPFILSDGGTGMDAENNCVPGVPPRIPLRPNQPIHGMLTPVIDPRDHFRLDIVNPQQAVRIRVTPSPDAPARHALLYPDVDLFIRDPGCANERGDPVRGNFPEEVQFVPGAAGAFVVRLVLKLPFGLPASTPAFEMGAAADADAAPRSSGGADCHPPCDLIGFVLEQVPPNPP